MVSFLETDADVAAEVKNLGAKGLGWSGCDPRNPPGHSNRQRGSGDAWEGVLVLVWERERVPVPVLLRALERVLALALERVLALALALALERVLERVLVLALALLREPEPEPLLLRAQAQRLRQPRQALLPQLMHDWPRER